MEHKVVAPTVGESITEVRILKWSKADGEAVKAGDVLLEVETDKATVEVAAEVSGALKILKGDGEVVKIGDPIGSIDDAAKGSAKAAASSSAKVAPAPNANAGNVAQQAGLGEAAAASNAGPAARKIAEEKNIDLTKMQGSGKDGRVTKGDLLAYNASVASSAAKTNQTSAAAAAPRTPTMPALQDRPGDRRVQMSRLRQRIAERLVEAQQTAAILTTFNEVDMSAVMEIRSKHKESFKAKYGVGLSFMSFFTRAVALALKDQAIVNASIDGSDIVYHDYLDIGIAVGTDRGLVVPVLRDVEKMTFVDIEKNIGALAVKARDGKLSIPEMSGGTFTISNGGTYGSLLSTPILNPPQTAILGMHKIQERPIALNGQVVIRPMMYLALSYDHRLIDGKEAVTFLVNIKQRLENPDSLGMEF